MHFFWHHRRMPLPPPPRRKADRVDLKKRSTTATPQPTMRSLKSRR